MVRLVKALLGHWVKRAQGASPGLSVFTRKAMTDLCYAVCTRKLWLRAQLYPQFATHNAPPSLA
jgi:proline dehydrogenase